MMVPERFVEFNLDENTWLSIVKLLYRLKQEVTYYHRKDKRAKQANRFEQSDANLCPFYKWRSEGIVIWVTWLMAT